MREKTKKGHEQASDTELGGLLRKTSDDAETSQASKYDFDAGPQSRELHRHLLASYLNCIPLLIIGPTGTGKTLAVRQFVDEMNGLASDENLKYPVPHKLPIPFIRYQCSIESGQYDLVGHDVIKSKTDINGEKTTEVFFEEGVLPRAIELANKNGIAILLLDEINAMSEQSQKALNSLLEGEGTLTFGDRSWKLSSDSRLVIIATMNDVNVGYGGIVPLNVDLERRFPLKMVLDYPSEEEELKILEMYSNNTLFLKKLIMLANHTRNRNTIEQINGFEGRPISTAELTNFVRVYEVYSRLFADNKDNFLEALESTILSNYRNNPKALKQLLEKARDIFGYEYLPYEAGEENKQKQKTPTAS